MCLSVLTTRSVVVPVNLTAGGAVLDPSPPSCAFTRGAASRQTAADTETVWTDAVGVRTAGRAPPVTLWCVGRQPAVLTVSALPVSVQCDLEIQQNHQVQVTLSLNCSGSCLLLCGQGL